MYVHIGAFYLTMLQFVLQCFLFRTRSLTNKNKIGKSENNTSDF